MSTFFTPGPAALYPSVEAHYAEAFRQNIGSISHRSAAFRKIYQHADEQLRILFGLPKETAVLFTGSATEIWERAIMNTVEHESFHLVNGSFSKKFFDFSKLQFFIKLACAKVLFCNISASVSIRDKIKIAFSTSFAFK